MDKNRPYHSVRSYVLRQGRLTSGQIRALKHYWPQYGIEFSHSIIDLNRVFGRVATRILDIGTGNGSTTIALAQAHPENDYLAIEVHRPGVGSLLRQAGSAGINNIRVICHDVVDILEHQLSSQSIDIVYIFFPDPWPKKRHHKRRLISQDFLDLLLPKLTLHARIFITTDWQDLAEHVISVCDKHPGLINLAGKCQFAPRPNWRPLTRFEQRAKDRQHPVRDLVYGLA